MHNYIISKYKNQGNLVVAAFVIMFTGILTSCTDIIDPAAANSLSAILAVIGEYLYAIIALVLVVILWILRPASIALATLGMLGVCGIVELSVNSLFLICIGIMMFLISFVPIRQYEPLVIISKHFKMPKKEMVREKHNSYHELLIQLFVGFITLIIEYSIFVKWKMQGDSLAEKVPVTGGSTMTPLFRITPRVIYQKVWIKNYQELENMITVKDLYDIVGNKIANETQKAIIKLNE